jgi:hypothetical protein
VTAMPGVDVGAEAVVGACSVIRGNLSAGMIHVGDPARLRFLMVAARQLMLELVAPIRSGHRAARAERFSEGRAGIAGDGIR